MQTPQREYFSLYSCSRPLAPLHSRASLLRNGPAYTLETSLLLEDFPHRTQMFYTEMLNSM